MLTEGLCKILTERLRMLREGLCKILTERVRVLTEGFRRKLILVTLGTQRVNQYLTTLSSCKIVDALEKIILLNHATAGNKILGLIRV